MKLFKIIEKDGHLNIKLITYLLLFLIFIVIFPYSIKFYRTVLSDDPGNWGEFGDYIGGILNPIFTLINIILLLYLAKIVNQKEDQRIIDELKYKDYKEITQKFYKIKIDNFTPLEKICINAKSMRDFLTFNIVTKAYFFNEIDNLTYHKIVGHIIATLDEIEKEALIRLGEPETNSGQKQYMFGVDVTGFNKLDVFLDIYFHQIFNCIEFMKFSMMHRDTLKYGEINFEELVIAFVNGKSLKQMLP